MRAERDLTLRPRNRTAQSQESPGRRIRLLEEEDEADNEVS